MNEELHLIFDIAKESMSNAITHLEKKLMNIRAGKANPNMLSSVTVEYYGSNTPLSQVANINTPDGRTIIVHGIKLDLRSVIMFIPANFTL